MTSRDRSEFREYLYACSNNQVRGVYEKEKRAGRMDYAHLAEYEGDRRGIDATEPSQEVTA